MEIVNGRYITIQIQKVISLNENRMRNEFVAIRNLSFLKYFA